MSLTPQVTITWNSLTLSGVSDPVSQITFELANFGNSLPCVPGTGVISPTIITATAVSGEGSVELWGNDVISPSGTYYVVTFISSSGNFIAKLPYQFVGTGSFDLSTLTPLS